MANFCCRNSCNSDRKTTMMGNPTSSITKLLVIMVTLSTLMATVASGLQLIPLPTTPEKEVFTGESFVITCLDPNRNEGEKLEWRDPQGSEVPTAPNAPIYVSSKPDGLQIVFFKLSKKHSGTFRCVKVKEGSAIEEVPFTVKVYKSIEYQGPTTFIAHEGDSYTAMCRVQFDNEVSAASVVWDKGGRNIVADDMDKYTVSETKPPNFRTSLHIKQIDKDDGGVYTCRATQFAKTISQFKQNDIHIRVQYKPKFPASMPADVWINKEDMERESVLDLNVTCIVDADPPAALTWYDPVRMVSIERNRLPDDITEIVERENMSVLRLKFRPDTAHHANGHHAGRGASSWPPGGNHYERPARGGGANGWAAGESTERKFECRAKNEHGMRTHKFSMKVGHLPPSPRVLSYTIADNNLTLVIEEPAVEPPLDYYRIEVTGKSLEFNASDVTAAAIEAPAYGVLMHEQGQGIKSQSQRQLVAMVNNTYYISMAEVPGGNHKLTLYAHNPVGWSQPLRDDNMMVTVVNGSPGAPSSLVASILVLALGLGLAGPTRY